MLTLISIGVLLLVFGSFCAWISGEVRTKEVLCVCWFMYVTSGSCGGMIALMVLVSKSLEGSDMLFALTLVSLVSSLFCVSVWLSTLLLQVMLSTWWDTFFYALDAVEEARLTPPLRPFPSFHARKVSRQLITVGQATPKLLVLPMQIRVSSTYFKPALPKRRKGKAATKLHFAPVSESEGLEERGAMETQYEKRRSESMAIGKREVKEGEEQLPVGNWAETYHKKCIICFENHSDAVFMNCGHGGICTDCSTTIWKRADMCHCCRSPIDHILHIEDVGGSSVKVVAVTYVQKKEEDQGKKQEGGTTAVEDGIYPV